MFSPLIDRWRIEAHEQDQLSQGNQPSLTAKVYRQCASNLEAFLIENPAVSVNKLDDDIQFCRRWGKSLESMKSNKLKQLGLGIMMCLDIIEQGLEQEKK